MRIEQVDDANLFLRHLGKPRSFSFRVGLLPDEEGRSPPLNETWRWSPCQFSQLTYSRHNGSGKTLDLLRAVIRRAKGVADLLLAQLRQDAANPFRLFDRDVF